MQTNLYSMPKEQEKATKVDRGSGGNKTSTETARVQDSGKGKGESGSKDRPNNTKH